MDKMQKQEKISALPNGGKVYHLPESYIRRCRYTTFLQKNKDGHYKLILWYIGPETGRLLGFYKDFIFGETVLRSYYINEDGSFKYDETMKFNFDELYDIIRKLPEVYCTEYMPYFLGITDKKPSRKGYGKIIPFVA